MRKLPDGCLHVTIWFDSLRRLCIRILRKHNCPVHFCVHGDLCCWIVFAGGIIFVQELRRRLLRFHHGNYKLHGMCCGNFLVKRRAVKLCIMRQLHSRTIYT